MFRIILYLFVLILYSSTSIYGAEYLECQNAAVGIFIAVSSNCSKAIYCDGVDSNIVECDSNTPYFSSDDQNCYSDVTICGDRPFNVGILTTATISTTTPSSPTTITTTLTSPTVISVTAAETALVSTTTSIPSTVATAPSTISTTLGTRTTWPPVVSTSSSTISSTTIDSTTSLSCPPVDDPFRPVFLPHPKSCSQYYLCYHGAATVMQCPNMMHFDVTQQGCNTAEKVNCQISAVIPRDQCLPHTVDVYPHATNCNYYYLCEYGYLMVMQCPFNMGWDYEKRLCVVKSKAKCYNEAALN